MNRFPFRSFFLIVALGFVLSACSPNRGISFCLGWSEYCGSDTASVSLTDELRNELEKLIGDIVGVKIAEAEGRLGDKIDASEQLSTDQLTALHKEVTDLEGKLGAHDALSAKAMHDVADRVDDLALLGNNPQSWATAAQELRDLANNSTTPVELKGFCLQASNGWGRYGDVNVLCWGGHVQYWTQAVNTTPVVISDVKKKQVVPGVVGTRTVIKIDNKDDTYYCRRPGKPDPEVNDTGWWLPNGDLWFPNTQTFRRFDQNGPVPTFTPGSPATAQATATPGGNPTATPAVGVTPNPGGGITIVISGQPITITNEINIELANAGISPEVLALLLQNQLWQQQILELLRAQENWPAGDIVILIINIVTGSDPVPGQVCLQVRTWSCDLNRWFSTPCQAIEAGARVMVFDPADCPNQLPTVPPGATATATQGGGGNPTIPPNPSPTPTSNGGGGASTPTRGATNPPGATATATATKPWWEPTVPPTATRGNGGNGSPTPEPSPTKPYQTPEPTDESTPVSTPVSTKEPIKACTLTDKQVMDMHGFSARQVKLVFTGENIEWDPCKWTLQAVGIGHVPLPLLGGFRYTVTEYPSERVSVWRPGSNNLEVAGATIRYVGGGAYDTEAAKWVLDDWTLWAGEFRFGANRTPAYRTENGNLVVNMARFPTRNPLWGPLEAAMLLGGLPSEWSLLSNPVQFKFKTGGRLVDLQYHGVGCYDHWRMGTCYRGAISQTDEATFNAVP